MNSKETEGESMEADTPQHTKEGPETQWSVASEKWREADLSGTMPKWDEKYEHVVSAKEASSAEKQKLVANVKEMSANYKADPTHEKVEDLLRYFKRIVSSLYKRIDVAEDAFLSMYTTFSMVQDPAKLLLSAHLELSELHRALMEQTSKTNELMSANEILRKETVTLRASYQQVSSNNSETALSELGLEVSSLQRELSAVSRNLSNQRKENERLLTVNSGLESKLIEARNSLHESESAVDLRLEAMNDELSSALADLSMLRQVSADRSGKTDNASAEAESDALLFELQKENTALKKQIEEVSRLPGPSPDVKVKSEEQVPGSPTSERNPEIEKERATLAAIEVRLKRKVRTLEGSIQEEQKRSERLQEELAEARRTISSLRGHIQGGASHDDSRSDFDVFPGSMGHVRKQEAGDDSRKFAMEEADFSMLLDNVAGGSDVLAPAQEPSGGGEAPSSEVVVDSIDQATALIRTLRTQRETLKKRVTEKEKAIAELRDEVFRIHRKSEVLVSDKNSLACRLQELEDQRFAEMGGHSAKKEQQMKTMLATFASASSESSGHTAVTIGAPVVRTVQQDSTLPQWRNSRARKTTAAVLGFVDKVSLLISHMITTNRITRGILVFYLMSLHLVVFGVLYGLSANYYHNIMHQQLQDHKRASLQAIQLQKELHQERMELEQQH